MPEISIDLNGVPKLLSNLKPDKAARYDEIKPLVLQELRHEMAPIICLLVASFFFLKTDPLLKQGFRRHFCFLIHENGSITKTCLFKYIENFTSKKLNFLDKKLWYFFHISAQNIDCGYSLELPRRGGSNEYPKCMFLSRNKKNNVYPCKPQFYYIKVGFKGVSII